MYYDRYEKKKGRKKGASRRKARLSPGDWAMQTILKLIAFALALALLAGGLLYALPPSLFAVEPEGAQLSLNDGLPMDCLNVLLLGTDILKQGSQRSDAMLIASIGFGKFKLTSVMRDTEVDIPGHGKGKLNAAYAYGGPELTMRTINQTFGLNLMHYAQVDFVWLAAVVDAIGGIEIPEITEAEMAQLNRNTLKSRRVFGPLGYTPRELTQYGTNIHVDGLQALSYARIRKIDSDYARTRRQRTVINAIIARIRANLWNPAMLVRLYRVATTQINTNMSIVMMLSLAEKALLTGQADTFQLPAKGTFTDDGSKLILDDHTGSRSAFMRFVYES